MLPIGINHMTIPRASARRLLDVAKQLGAVGVELRNDLDRPLFDGETPAEFGAEAQASGTRILALAEVKAFNQDTATKRDTAENLISTASVCGAEGVALIPHVAEATVPRPDQRTALRTALDVLRPVLESYSMIGLIEPLGFSNSSLRFKEDVVRVLDDMQRPACFKIVHDTFHHHLAGGGPGYADLTGIVHISGITDPAPAVDQMQDAHRVLVDADDRLGNIAQLSQLQEEGFAGPASFEAFSPEIHQFSDPTEALAGSIAFITAQLAAEPGMRA